MIDCYIDAPLLTLFMLQVYSEVVTKLTKAFAGVVSKIGDPLLPETLIGPLHTPIAVEVYKKTVAEIVKQGGKIEFGGKVRNRSYELIQFSR